MFSRTVVEQKLYFKYFPHYVGHYIGLDNNDTPTISCNTPLAPGVTFCIEPGLYVRLGENGDA